MAPDNRLTQYEAAYAVPHKFSLEEWEEMSHFARMLALNEAAAHATSLATLTKARDDVRYYDSIRMQIRTLMHTAQIREPEELQ